MRHLITRLMSTFHASLYRLTDGRFVGNIWGMRVLLLTTTGRKSGQPRTTPLNSLEHDGGYVVVASLGGAPTHPDWFLNLRHEPRANILIGNKRLDVVAEVMEPAERAELWPRLIAIAPTYAQYASRTEREIPLVLLRPTSSD